MWLYWGKKRQLLCVDPDNLSNLNSAALGGTHQFKVKSILCRPPSLPPSSDSSRLSFTLVLLLSILFCYNYVSNSKCNCRRVGGWWWCCVYGGRRGEGNCYACTTKCNIKKLLSEKGTFWQMYGGGQLPPYVCRDGDNKSGSNYQSSSGEPVKTLGLARSDSRCHGDTAHILASVCLPGHKKKKHSHIFITQII